MLFTMRAVPDLALNANVGQIEVINGAFAHNAGTSIVSPELAGFFAQENAYLLSIGNACGASGTSPCAPLGDAHYPIYAEALNPTPGVHVPFYDITSGCSSNDITAKDHLMAFCAEKGYDEVTGWGSANMLQLAWAINWESTAASGIPYTVFSGPAVNHWYNSNQNVSWTINDYTAGSPVGTGIAGFSQGWDSIPTDSRTQPHGETTVSTDTFYTGPHFHNTNTGCLALASGKACFGGVTQGCHTAHVRGWNNQGLTTGDTTYGPVCYDTIAPTAHIALSGTLSDGVYLSSVAVTLSASDPGAPTTGSGVKAIYFVLDGGSPTVYFGPITVSTHGAHTIQYYSSDEAGNVEAHQSTTFSIKSTTTTTLDSSANPAKYGAVTFNATVKPTSGSTPTGTVTFKDGATILGSAGLSTAGVASYMATTLSVGSHTITAVYNGSSTDLTSTSAAITEVVTATTTTTKVTSDLNPAPFGSNILLNATISAATGATPSGNITFKDGTTTLATLTVNAAGVATYTTDNLAVGSHSITAVYVGDTDDLTSTSTVLTQTIQPADTTTKVTSSLNPAPFGSTVTFKASVTAPSSGITPTGTVTFKNGTSVLGTATLTSGSASLAVDTLTVGTHSITAVYSADKDYATSTSTPLSESITADN